ncbi:hypothetical protein PINS_up013123 [Pythium insidiosum]|nr:hypothetical protein PINS_up013123 [Pythium insidiosum]
MSRRRLSIGRQRRSSRERDDAPRVSGSAAEQQQQLNHSERLCAALQEALVTGLADLAASSTTEAETRSGGVLHCSVVDVSVRELQYRLLGASRYWHRAIKQEKLGKRWEVLLYEVCCRKSTLSRLRAAASWHEISRLPPEDVQLRSLGLFDSEKAAQQAFDTAFRAREIVNPLAGPAQLRSEPLPEALVTQFHVTIVSDRFSRRSQRERLSLVYEVCVCV